jgi:CHAT domain-containing protein/Tfp pilus assembly protein PilF
MILNNIALATSDLGENQRALEYYNQVLSLEKTAGNLAGEAKTRNNMAEIYSRTGHKQKALEEYNRALSLLHSAGDAVGEGRILNNIGWLHEDLGAMQMSLNYYQQALPLLHSVSPADEATTLTNIGTIYANLGEQEKGLEYYSQALPLLLSSGDQVGRALTLNNIGTSYSNLGKKDKALEYYDQALVLERAIGDRGKEAITLENVAGLQDAKEDWAAAEENYERALALSASVTDQLTEAGILAALMYHWDEVGNIPFAIFFGKQSVNVYQHIRGNLQGLDKQLQRSFTTSVSGSYRKLADLLVVEGRLPEALDVIDLLKEQEYSEFTRATAAPRTRPLLQTPSEQAAAANIKALIDRFTAVNNKSADLAHKSSRTPPEEIRLAELTSQESLVSGELSKVVYALNRTFVPDNKDQDIAQAELLNSPEAATWEKLVPEGAMALYTLVAASHYRIVIVTPATIFARSYNIGRDEVRRKVKEFSKALRDPNSNPLPSAQALYKVVVAPVEADLKANNPHTLIWSLDDLLRYIPISALHDGQHYMVEHYAIDVTTLGGSIEDIHLLDAAHVRGAAMGISEKYEGFEALPAVAGELNSVVLDPAVERSHGVIPGIIKLNNQFTEAALTEELQQGFGVVHIASHFYAYPTDDTRSYLLLAGKDTAGTAYHLTLAAMREDARIRFDGVALLVLSACETALGGTTPDGREVDGLGTVAQKKGAITVLASLWSVEDASTARLMGIFYDRWIRGGLAKAEALRQAQLELLLGKTTESEVRIQVNTGKASKVKKPVRVSMVETYSHPYYWAPFILMGNWR